MRCACTLLKRTPPGLGNAHLQRIVNHTVEPPCPIGTMPHSSDSAATIIKPRPVGSSFRGRRGNGCWCDESCTSTVISPSVLVTCTSKGVRACTTQLVANSDVMSWTRSTISVGRLPRASRTKRRASDTDEGFGANCRDSVIDTANPRRDFPHPACITDNERRSASSAPAEYSWHGSVAATSFSHLAFTATTQPSHGRREESRHLHLADTDAHRDLMLRQPFVEPHLHQASLALR
jgi:hypothetical protein